MAAFQTKINDMATSLSLKCLHNRPKRDDIDERKTKINGKIAYLLLARLSEYFVCI